jgi:hypothetical protein
MSQTFSKRLLHNSLMGNTLEIKRKAVSATSSECALLQRLTVVYTTALQCLPAVPLKHVLSGLTDLQSHLRLLETCLLPNYTGVLFQSGHHCI